MRLLVNLIFIILFFVLINSILNSLIPSYKIYLNSVEEKNKIEFELLKTKRLEEQFRFFQSNSIADIIKAGKSGYFNYFLPSNFIDYELTIFINQLFLISGFPQPNIYSFAKEEITHPQFKKSKITKFTFSVTERGKLDEIIKLINNLENSSRIFTIESIDLKPLTENNEVEANLKISTYYFLK